MLRASIRREKRSCLKRLYSFSPLPSTISQKAWRSEWPLELWLAIQVQKPLSGRLVWPLGLACKISQLSIPIRTDGKSRLNAFYWGSMSAIVEPIGALLGAVAVLSMTAILPYALSFAAGAMIFVVVGRVDPRLTDQWQHRRCDPRSHGWLCHYDDPRRRFGIRN